MLITECGKQLSGELSGTLITPPEGTPLSELAAVIWGMAKAYADDGRVFFQNGDTVNALASFYYGFAWLHFGRSYGLLSSSTENSPACPFTGANEKLPASLSAKLSEKSHRYHRLLDTACESVVPAPEPETSGGMFARRVILIALSYAGGGEGSLSRGEDEEALARFSYGHGWLDAGVRSGLLIPSRNREIFTI